MSNFSVEIRSDEPFEKALRRFTSKTRKAGLLRDLKKRRFYTKPSVQKKINRQKASADSRRPFAWPRSASFVARRGSVGAGSVGAGAGGRGAGGRGAGGDSPR